MVFEGMHYGKCCTSSFTDPVNNRAMYSFDVILKTKQQSVYVASLSKSFLMARDIQSKPESKDTNESIYVMQFRLVPTPDLGHTSL